MKGETEKAKNIVRTVFLPYPLGWKKVLEPADKLGSLKFFVLHGQETTEEIMQNQAIFIAWSKTMSTSIKIVDQQHLGMLSLINTFFFHKTDADKDIDRFLVPTAEILKAYTRLHFLTLEKLMRETGYPEIEKETRRHEELMRLIKNMEIKYRKLHDADGFLLFLKNYWAEHSCKPDMGYILHIKQFYENT